MRMPAYDFFAAVASIASAIAVAQDSATGRRYDSATLETQPALITKSYREYADSFFMSTICSGCCSAFATHRGTKACTTAVLAAIEALRSDVPAVTQPPHTKPMIIAATAPPTTPHIAGFTWLGSLIGASLMSNVWFP